MSNAGSNDWNKRDWANAPHVDAYADARPELFEGVLSRRVLAFIIDAIIIAVPVILAHIVVFLLGIVTFGLGWVLFWIATPATVLWALLYYGMTIGGPRSATVGMATMGLQLRTWYGAPGYFVLGAVHAIAYWISMSALTPLVLLVGLFNRRRRLLHDFLLGTVIVNTAALSAPAQGTYQGTPRG